MSKVRAENVDSAILQTVVGGADFARARNLLRFHSNLTSRRYAVKMSRSSASRSHEHEASVSISFELAVDARTYTVHTSLHT